SEGELVRKYKSQKDALDSMAGFCNEVGWPKPAVVTSGWGFHIYWPLADHVAPEDYEDFAHNVVAVANVLGLKLDRSAMDVSRVFRVPGTHNYKVRSNPRPVRIMRSIDSVDFYEML